MSIHLSDEQFFQASDEELQRFIDDRGDIVREVSQINALPDMTVIVSSVEQVAFQKYWGNLWRGSNSAEIRSDETSELDDILPARIVYLPEAST